MADCRTEHQEQVALFTWATVMSGRHPELKLLYAVPNGAFMGGETAQAKLRGIQRYRKLEAEGLKKGVPDICLPCARQGYHGLYIELKRIKGGTVSHEQKEWLAALNTEGYKAVVCRGFDEAREVIEEYLSIGE
jgi:hypothetical protein